MTMILHRCVAVALFTMPVLHAQDCGVSLDHPRGTWAGLYTDTVSYGPGDVVRIFGNWDGENVLYRILRVDDAEEPHLFAPVHEVGPFAYGPLQRPVLGSFLELPEDLLSGQAEFTIEGWVNLTYTNPVTNDPDAPKDFMVLAGSVDAAMSEDSGAWIGISPDGVLVAGIVLKDGSHVQTTLLTALRNQQPLVLQPNVWHYVALTFGPTVHPPEGKLRLYHVTATANDGLVNLSASATTGPGTVATGYPLLIGARMEATLWPPDSCSGTNIGDGLNGCVDGVFDRWGFWSKRLTLGELQDRKDRTVPGPSLDSEPCSSEDAICNYLEAYYDFEVYNSGSESIVNMYPSDSLANDSSGNARYARIVNHGTPGTASVDCEGQPAPQAGETPSEDPPPNYNLALRLNHDQLIDARFDRWELEGAYAHATDLTDDNVSNPTPGIQVLVDSWPSGLYVVQAVFEDDGQFLPDSLENKQPEHFASFVVRPDPESIGEIAVLLPTNTWLAYNGWPASPNPELDPVPTTGAPCPIPMRKLACATEDGEGFFPQGNNSVYGEMGDGVSPNHFSGWRRPNLLASPVLKVRPALEQATPSPYDQDPDLNKTQINDQSRALNDMGAYLSWKFFQWAASPLDGSASPLDPIECDVYCDWDLDDGQLQLTEDGDPRYKVLVIVGKPEYYSASILFGIVDYAKTGGNIVCLGGNAIAWRSELFDQEVQSQTVSAELLGAKNKVLEVRKWPIPVTAVEEAVSVKDGRSTGNWRKVLQSGGVRPVIIDDEIQRGGTFLVNGTPGGTAFLEDYVLGTLNQMSAPPTGPSGFWRVRDSTHWLWDSEVGMNETLCAVGRVVGEEVDGYACSTDTQECQGNCPAFGDTLPSWGQFPFAKKRDPNNASSRYVAILADGDFRSRLSTDPASYSSVGCCLSDGSCVQITEEECTAAGGTYTPCGSVAWVNHYSDFFNDDPDELDQCPGNPALDFTTKECVAPSSSQSCPLSPNADANGPGQIVYYETRWADSGGTNGRVLNLASIDAVLGLREYPVQQGGTTSGDFRVSNLVRRTLGYMLSGAWPQDTWVPPSDCAVRR